MSFLHPTAYTLSPKLKTMQDITRQLENVRRSARRMLFAQRFLQWSAALIGIGLALGLIDFGLRLPWWMRLVIGLSVAFTAAVWLSTRLARAARFWPPLSELALRVERMHPHLAGVFASAVDFTEHEQAYRDPVRTAVLAEASVDAAAQKLQGVKLRQLIDPTRTARCLAVFVVVLLLLASAVGFAPRHSALAASRWLLPLGSAEWPQRTAVEALTDQAVWPTDTPLRLTATVTKGYTPGMRVVAHYRVIGAEGIAGPWQEPLMTEQADGRGRFERLIEPPPAVARAIAADPLRSARVEYYFEAGDDTSDTLSLPLVARPEVRRVDLSIEPPDYAAGLVTAQSLPLHEQNTAVVTAAALPGSTLALGVTLNKPVAAAALTTVAPGWPAAELTREVPDRFTLRTTLNETVETPLRLIDEYGLENLSERLYRVEALEDRPPTASLLEPAADQSVLPTAVIPIAALAQDDVGIARLLIEAEVPAPPDASASDQTVTTITLDERVARRASLDTQTTLDLQPLALKPGQVVTLFATATDVFDLDGVMHDPVRSPPRRLRIIDEATLISQIRTELAALRQQAVRLEQTQRQVMDQPAAAAEPQQSRLTERVAAQSSLVESLQARAATNRLDAPALDEVMREAAALLDEAQQASDEAEQGLRESADPAATESAQERAARALEDLTTLLDQGQAAQALQMALRQLQAQQSALEQQTRELLPQTIGRDAEQLTEEQRQALTGLAERQRQLSEQAEAMVRQMRTASEALSRQGETDREQAAAAALSEAASIAQRQGLQQQMDRAAAATEDNRLSQAGDEQNQSLDTIEQMLKQMREQDELRQAMLRRRLAQLQQTLQRLIERQTNEISRLDAAEVLGPLEPAQAALRRATMAAQEQAEGAPETAEVAPSVAKAVGSQGEAIVAMRAEDKPPAAVAEDDSLEALEQALAMLEELKRQAEQDQTDQEREELREAYLALAERQEGLAGQTAEMLDAGPITRKQRAELLGLSQDQQQLGQEASDLSEQVAQTLVFKRLHRRLDVLANRAANGLRRGVADDEVLRGQQQVALLLSTMAAALDEDRQDSEFVENQSGGGGGGGGGGEPQLIPPVAELKLLRGVQETLYRATRRLETDPEPSGSARMEQRLQELSTQQRELSDLGNQMVEQMQQAQQPAVLPDSPEGGGE